MANMSVRKGGVKCDNCDWREETSHEDIPKWHNKLCPKCNESIIVNDEDYLMWQMLDLTMKMMNSLPEIEGPTISCSIDTAPMRE